MEVEDFVHAVRRSLRERRDNAVDQLITAEEGRDADRIRGRIYELDSVDTLITDWADRNFVDLEEAA